MCKHCGLRHEYEDDPERQDGCVPACEGQLQEWADRFKWTERATAWDGEQERLASEQNAYNG